MTHLDTEDQCMDTSKIDSFIPSQNNFDNQTFILEVSSCPNANLTYFERMGTELPFEQLGIDVNTTECVDPLTLSDVFSRAASNIKMMNQVVNYKAYAEG